jgi:hypothetical protein
VQHHVMPAVLRADPVVMGPLQQGVLALQRRAASPARCGEAPAAGS